MFTDASLTYLLIIAGVAYLALLIVEIYISLKTHSPMMVIVIICIWLIAVVGLIAFIGLIAFNGMYTMVENYYRS